MAQHTHQTSKPLAPFPSEADLQTWAAELDAVAEKLALRYLTGRLSTVERKMAGSWRSWPQKRRPTACSAS